MADVLTFTPAGIFCAAGGFCIDPGRPVDLAVITHAHADHARPGMGAYLATPLTAPVLRHRLGDVRIEVMGYCERRRIGDATVSFHPAGHVPGSAQVRVEVGGQVWVVSGDYKLVADGLSTPFEPVACHAFISECTFGLPVFRWPDPAGLAADINRWWAGNAAAGRVSLIGAYSLGKAQRVLAALDPGIGPILTHPAVEGVTAVLRGAGLVLPATQAVTPDLAIRDWPGALVVAPPQATADAWARRFGDAAVAVASGWMALRGLRRRRGADRGFVMSDHADWDGLNAAIAATGAERVYVTHGYTVPFRRWLQGQGHDARLIETGFGGDERGDDGGEGADGNGAA